MDFGSQTSRENGMHPKAKKNALGITPGRLSVFATEYSIMSEILVIGLILLLFTSFPHLQAIGSVIVFFLCPGYLILGMRKEDLHFAAVLVISATLSFLACTYSMYFLSLLAIFPTKSLGLMCASLIVLGYIFLGFIQYRSDRWLNLRINLNELGLLFLLFLIAVLIRFPFLDYSDFQTDEARALLLSKKFVQGDGEILFTHKKGPTEILIPIIPMLLASPNEFSTRSPFLLAGILAVLGTLAIGEEILGNRRIGALAGLFLALNGYFIAFSRFTQYHAVLFIAFQAVAICTFKALREEKTHAQGFWGGIAAACAGFGLLTHYDFILFAFLSLLILALGIQRVFQNQNPIHLLSMTLFLAILAPLTFYLPFVLHPNFPATLEYYLLDRVGGGTTANTRFDLTWLLSSWVFYLSIYYFALLIALMMVGTFLIRKDWRSLGLKGDSGANAYILMWFSLYFIFYGILMGRPITHGYTMFIPGVFLAAKGATHAVSFRRNIKLWKVSSFALLMLIFSLTLYYNLLFFWSHDPEYVTSFPESKDFLFPVIEGRGTQEGHFGIPESRAWKVPGVIFRDGILDGPYRSNEKPEVTEWYLSYPQAKGSILYFLYSIGIGDREFDLDELEAEWTPVGQVFKDNRKTIVIFYNGTSGVTLGDMEWDNYKERFDELLEREFSV
ncbi:MAG: ArnT family glycosyltransferase [Candidatus Heimdallarchaeota archaeon]